MGRRFEEFKSRMQSQMVIEEIQKEIIDHEAYLATSEDSHATRMLKAAVAGMRANLSELQQAHKERFRRRFAR